MRVVMQIAHSGDSKTEESTLPLTSSGPTRTVVSTLLPNHEAHNRACIGSLSLMSRLYVCFTISIRVFLYSLCRHTS